MAKKKIIKEIIVGWIKEFYEREGRSPTRGDCATQAEFSIKAVEYRFGPWSRALEAAGCPQRELPNKARWLAVECKNCKQVFQKQEGEIKRSPNHYCSRSCAAQINNRKYPKREKTYNCKKCSLPIPYGYTYCRKCWATKLTDTQIERLTLEQVADTAGKQASKFSRIREHARSKMRKEVQICENCGYDKHVEVAHVKSISSFSPDTLISVINDKINLVVLCKNCHWEFDHDILSLEQIKRSPAKTRGSR